MKKSYSRIDNLFYGPWDLLFNDERLSIWMFAFCMKNKFYRDEDIQFINTYSRNKRKIERRVDAIIGDCNKID